MRIYKKLEKSMNERIKVGDIIDYCEKCAECARNCANRALGNVGHGDSKESALGAVAFFTQQERIYRYEVPQILLGIINEPLQTERDKETGGKSK